MAPPPSPAARPRFSRESPEVRRRILVEAAIRCLAAGGIQAFTVERICREAGVSRGLLNHYFESKDDLLVEVYRSSLGETLMGRIAEAAGRDDPEDCLRAMIDAAFLPETFTRETLRVWLALWAEVATNAELQAAHRALYHDYRQSLTAAISAVSGLRDVRLDASALARNLIALVDGLWLEWCLDSSVLTPDEARQACYEMIEARLGFLRG